MYSKLRKSLSGVAAVAVIAAGLLGAGVPAPQHQGAAAAAADKPSGASYGIVVLGDSLAAGYQKGFTEQSVPYGFAEHVYEQALLRGLRAEFANYGVIGLRTDSLARWLNAAAAGRTVAESDVQTGLLDPRAGKLFEQTPALAADLKEAELVLISTGGNDFLGLVNELGAGTVFASLSPAAQTGLKAEVSGLIDNYKAELTSVLSTVLKLRPQAEIVIANQYLPIPFMKIRDQITYIHIPESTALFLKESQSQLNETLAGIVQEFREKGASIKVADAASAIEASILSNTSVGDTDGADIHPTARGYAELGKAYTAQIWGDYLAVQPRKTGVPISVVVNGKEIITDYAPVIKQGRTFLSLRDITDALGAELKWNAATSTASISLEDRTVDITVGATAIRVNGQTAKLNAEPAYLQQFPGEKKTYVPLAALSEGLGFQVVYRETLKAAFINS